MTFGAADGTATDLVIADGKITWTVPTVAVRETLTFTVSSVCTVKDVDGKIGENWVYVDEENGKPTDPDDPDTKDNTPKIDVANPHTVIKKTASKKSVYRYDELVYTITVTNTGKAAAKDVYFEDSLPDGLELKEVKVSSGTRDLTDPEDPMNLKFCVPYLDAGRHVTVTIKTIVTKAGPESVGKNVAVITEEGGEPTDPEDPDKHDETPPVPVRLVTVTFIDWDGKVLKKVKLNVGDSTTTPLFDELHHRAGWEFVFWDGVWWNVQKDEIVYARYKPLPYVPEEPDHFGIIIDADIPLAGGYMTTVGDCFD